MGVGPAVIAGRAAVGGLYNQQKTVKAEFDSAQKQLTGAEKKYNDLVLGYSKGTPPTPEQVMAAGGELKSAREKFAKAAQNYGVAVQTTTKAQEEVLKLQTAGESGLQLDGVSDAASLTVAQQTKLLGAPVAFNLGEAVEGDGKRISVAIKTEKKKGAQMLAFQLEGADPAFQKELVGRAAKNIKAMAQAANQDASTATALLDAISKTSGPAREQMLAIVAKELPSTEIVSQAWHETTQKGMLVGQLRADVKQGKNLDVAADLITALKKAGRPSEAGDVTSITADGIKALRGEFEKRQAKVHDLDGHLGRLAGGFGTALGETRSQDAMKAFREKHKGDYAKLDEAAEKYLKVKDVVGKLAQMPDKDRKMIEHMSKMGLEPDLNRDQRLGHEVAQFTGKNFEKLFDTEAGKKQLEAGLKDQLSGKKSWIDDLVEGSKKNKDLKEFVAEKVPNLVAKGIGHMALATDSANLKGLLKANAGLLALDNVDDFMKTANELSKTGRTAEEVNTALGKLKSENYSPALKKLGGLLAVPGALEALGKLGSNSVPQNIKAVIDGVEVLSALSNSKVLDAVTRKLGPIGSGIAIGSGLGKLWEGKIAEGASDVMAGVGTFMMTAGSLASKIPGGQLIGAALVVGSVIVGLFAETDSEKAEKAAQKDAKAYLMGGGLSPKAAEALGNLNESDHRDVGGFINQVAPRFGMKPGELLEHLAGLSSSDLREFTEMVFKMKVDGKGNYAEKKVGGAWVGDHEEVLQFGPSGTISPQSMDTAEKWMRNHLESLRNEKPD